MSSFNSAWRFFSNRGADERALGPAVSIEVLYGGKSYPASSFVRDDNGKAIAYRFTGNRKIIPLMRTGCVVCLESRPGGKIGNAAYSMRDLARNAARFSLVPVPSIEGEGEVTIRISAGGTTQTAPRQLESRR